MDTESVADIAARALRVVNAVAPWISSLAVPECPERKYLDVERWMKVCARRAVALDLHLSRPLKILDIGTGCGYFPIVATILGHRVEATDVRDRHVVFEKVTNELGLEVGELDIEAMVPLPGLESYDLVTAYMVTFNRHGSPAPWGIPEWSSFVDDVLRRLRPSGRLVLELNREPGASLAMPAELEDHLISSYGADFTGHWPHRPERGGHRVVIRS